MPRALHHRLITLLLCLSIAAVALPAEAQIGPSGSQVAGILVALVAVGAAAGVGTFYLVRRAPFITGCAVTNGAGIDIQNEADQQTFLLIGDIAGVRVGNRVRVKGRKKKGTAAQRSFAVEKLSKDYGPCKSTLVTP